MADSAEDFLKESPSADEFLNSQPSAEDFLGQSAEDFLSDGRSFTDKALAFGKAAITPFEWPHKLLTETLPSMLPGAPEALSPGPINGMGSMMLEAGKSTLAANPLVNPRGTAEIAGEFLSPAPIDIAAFGLGPLVRAIRPANKAAASITKTAEEVFKPVASLDEAIIRLETAAKKVPSKPSILLPSTSGPIPEEVLGANLSKLDTTDDVKRLISDVAASNRTIIDDARRGEISFSETRRLANELGLTYDDLLKRRRGEAWNAENTVAARQLLAMSGRSVVEAAKNFAAGAGNLSDFALKSKRHLEVQSQAAGVRAEAGRALSAHRITTGDTFNKTVEFLLENSKETTENLARMIAKLDPNNTRQLNTFIRDSVEGTFGDKVYEAWINALLSGPQTHIVNATSNALTMLSRPLIERPARALAEAARAVWTGDKRQRFAGEVGADLFGMFNGISEGAVNALRTFGDGLSELGPGRLEEISRTASSIKGLPGKLINIPSRALQAADEFFKTVARSGEVSALAYRSAAMKGLRGQEKADHIAGIISRSIPEAESIWKAATSDARYRTFTAPIGDSAQALNRWRMGTPGARVIVPFFNTPINIAKYGLERTPLNFLRLGYKHWMGTLERGPELVDEIVKPIIGSLVMAPVAAYAAQGRITGGGPRDQARRNVLRASGWQPYSIRMGDKYYGYGRIEPLGMIVGLAADYAELFDVVDKQEAAGKMSLAVAQNISNKVFLKGISDFLNAVSDPDRYGNRWLQGIAGTVVPTGVAQYARAFDENLRKPRTPAETIMSRVPGLSKDVPILRDIWGQPVAIPGSPVQRLMSPFYESQISSDKSTKEMVRLGIEIQTPRVVLNKVKLDNKEIDDYISRSGALAKELVDTFTHSKGYENLPDHFKEDRIKSLFSHARSITASSMVDVQRRASELKIKKWTENK